MRVSVIIPVYRAERFVQQAVESALTQPETGEIILVEDASPDNSLQVCRRLTAQHDKLRLLRHPDGGNHGAGASRNLGIRNARFDFIAFLDADDIFLPGRFSTSKQTFGADPSVEGVYEAVGRFFDSARAEQRWRERDTPYLTTMSKHVSPEQLFEMQSPVGKFGYCPTGGWVVKRSVFAKTGLFDEHLRLHQDTAMYVKLAAVGKMLPGRLDEPVAMRRLHDRNRISASRSPIEAYQNRLLMWGTLWEWSKHHLNVRRQHLVLKRLLGHASKLYGTNSDSDTARHLQATKQLLLLLIRYPSLSKEQLFWKKMLWKLPYVHQLRTSLRVVLS